MAAEIVLSLAVGPGVDSRGVGTDAVVAQRQPAAPTPMDAGCSVSLPARDAPGRLLGPAEGPAGRAEWVSLVSESCLSNRATSNPG